MMDVDDCEKAAHCKNANERCLFCDGRSQYKEVKYKNYNSMSKYKTPSKKKKGMGLEEKVRTEYNQYMAKRMPLSGGITGLEGDVKTVHTLIECKEKNVKSGGKKQITIKKEWHDQIEDEAFNHGLIPILIYGFNVEGESDYDMEEVYFSTKYEYLLELLHKVKYLEEKINRLEKED
jgi:hypothetical protein